MQILNQEELYFVESSFGSYKIKGLIAAPNNTFKNKNNTWFFVNSRWVDSPVIRAALMAAYRGLLMHGEYPLSVIFLEGPQR